jgi:hypothetical protein
MGRATSVALSVIVSMIGTFWPKFAQKLPLLQGFGDEKPFISSNQLVIGLSKILLKLCRCLSLRMKGFFLVTVETGCCEEELTRKHYKFSKSRFNSENETAAALCPSVMASYPCFS